MKRTLYLVASAVVLLAAAPAARGEKPMPAEPQLQKALIEVENAAFSCKAFYGAKRPNQQASAAIEQFLRVWGGFTADQPVYFAAAQDSGTYMLSLVSDPGPWSSAKYPKLELERLKAEEGQLDAFRAVFASPQAAEDSGQQLAEALAELVAQERGITALPPIIKRKDTELLLTFREPNN